jgi:hypothetical protein
MKLSNSMFQSPEDAVEIGYEVGHVLRLNRQSKSKEPKHLLHWGRNQESEPHAVFWKIGFRAGYRGWPKPES